MRPSITASIANAAPMRANLASANTLPSSVPSLPGRNGATLVNAPMGRTGALLMNPSVSPIFPSVQTAPIFNSNSGDYSAGDFSGGGGRDSQVNDFNNFQPYQSNPQGGNKMMIWIVLAVVAYFLYKQN